MALQSCKIAYHPNGAKMAIVLLKNHKNRPATGGFAPKLPFMICFELMCKFKTNSLPKCFSDFFEIPSNVHSYSTRYASGDNYSLTRFKNTISQRSIRYVGPKLWSELPSDLKNYAQKIFIYLLNM